MARLIDANEFCKDCLARNTYNCTVCNVGTAPTVDAVEVVHGLWLDKTEVIVKPYYPPLDIPRVDCSVCGHIFFHTSALTYNYCPNCGARMDGDPQ